MKENKKIIFAVKLMAIICALYVVCCVGELIRFWEVGSLTISNTIRSILGIACIVLVIINNLISFIEFWIGVICAATKKKASHHFIGWLAFCGYSIVIVVVYFLMVAFTIGMGV